MKKLLLLLLVAVLTAVSSIGCSSSPEPYKYEDEREVRKGPGLFSGEDGEFKIYTSGEKEEEKEAEKKTADEQKTPEQNQP